MNRLLTPAALPFIILFVGCSTEEPSADRINKSQRATSEKEKAVKPGGET